MHDIYESRFVAVRKPAWHQLGVVFDEPIPPSEAVKRADLDLVPEVVPLLAATPDGKQVPTGFVAVGRWEEDRFVPYGQPAREFQLVRLDEVLPVLDEVASRYPLSAAGTLARGGEVFFTLDAGRSEIAGEEYDEYLVYRHSYTPGVANTIMYTPVRTVCRNTLIAGEAEATIRLSTPHVGRATERTKASVVVAEAAHKASRIKQRLKRLAEIQLSQEQTIKVLEQVYAPYAPSDRLPSGVADLVDDDTLRLVTSSNERQRNYADRLIETTMAAYERFNDEFPAHAGTAYALYQAVVEAADWRKGRASAVESAVVGARAAEKARAWTILASL
ncbi:MAG TPA: DUF932 domain-containing protein, partial [Dehalococcoidia bacterium]|nr:DUF932 domain-containing protein [Dehalococcoidia bacterium]